MDYGTLTKTEMPPFEEPGRTWWLSLATMNPVVKKEQPGQRPLYHPSKITVQTADSPCSLDA